MLAHRDRFTAVPWSQHYDVPINYVGHAKKWDQLVIAGDLAASSAMGVSSPSLRSSVTLRISKLW